MLPIHVVYAFISYLLLALLVPLAWALTPVWRKARLTRQVSCPAAGHPAVVKLDAWYAVKMHAMGNDDKRVGSCSAWPRCGHCRQECLAQLRLGGAA